MTAALGVYVHWPYCRRICPYCDFNVVRERGQADEQAALGAAILADLRAHAAIFGPRALGSLYFGGGTPSLMDPALAGEIIATCATLWPPVADCEITLEANPLDADAARFAAFAGVGVERLSLGVQSLDDASLRFLGRDHDAAAGRRAAETARAAFPRLSIDLIYALPDQQAAAWKSELTAAIALGAEHVSAYQLTIEPGVPFDRRVRRGKLVMPAADVAAELYQITDEVLLGAGLAAYEVSNHAAGEAARSRHNLIYWRCGDYVGIGPGAHGRLTLADSRRATVAPRAVAAYIGHVSSCGVGSEQERLDADQVSKERLVMGLRTVEGVDLAELAPMVIDDGVLGWLAGEGLIRRDGGRMAITRRGRPLTDRITLELARGAVETLPGAPANASWGSKDA